MRFGTKSRLPPLAACTQTDINSIQIKKKTLHLALSLSSERFFGRIESLAVVPSRQNDVADHLAQLSNFPPFHRSNNAAS